MIIPLGVRDGEAEQNLDACPYCHRHNSHAFGCVSLLSIAASSLTALASRNPVQSALRQASLFADALDDDNCAEAIHWRAVAEYLQQQEQ